MKLAALQARYEFKCESKTHRIALNVKLTLKAIFGFGNGLRDRFRRLLIASYSILLTIQIISCYY